ncbi:cation transport protein-domain-containing protein [Russula aff. rugulosa BPL654]|nr:cation transport protein-domain-containing protein [Russula aff. rugulosa BPL654]
MPLVDDEPSKETYFGRLHSFLRLNLNFYRLHILYFTFTPLIFSGIFYASNGRFHIAYIDALFNSVSAMAVCGLASVDLSSLTGWQQAILFIQMCIGNPVLISWVVVYVRRYMFTIHCEAIVRAATRKATPISEADGVGPRTLSTLIASLFGTGSTQLANLGSGHGSSPTSGSNMDGQGTLRRLRPDMIRRIDDAPKLVDPSGSIIDGQAGPSNVRTMNQSDNLESSSSTAPHDPHHPLAQESRSASSKLSASSSESRVGGPLERHSEDHHSSRSRSKAPPVSSDPYHQLRHSSIATAASNADTERAMPGFPTVRTQTIEFAPYPRLRHRTSRDKSPHDRPASGLSTRNYSTNVSATEYNIQSTGNNTTIPLYRHETMRPNSTFEELTEEQLEELGGVEFRALNALLWIVGIYHICVQLVSFAIIAPYISTNKWKSDFLPPQQKRPVVPTWFSLFQVVSAYTNAGMSLVDQSMVPFQRAYPMIFAMIFVILAGNTAFPIFLRFSVYVSLLRSETDRLFYAHLRWITTKLVPKQSQLNETLHFLLDHPRRCFIYLFPSHQTWFLLTVLIILNTTDWFFFLLLDIGNEAITSIPVGVRIIDGMLQATAVRAAGFAIVNLSALAPAVKVLYVIMMYISIYPIAMSVRATNVYEEKSLGIYEDDASIDEEENFSLSGNRMTIWGNYLTMHARKQLAFDMWWLGLALFLVCIIERDQLVNEDNATWFNIFNILFELVSAYGGVGLSLGVPYDNYSLSGAFRPLSKLIMCFVMLRGRHRGLPVAIDRAVLLPFEYQQLPGDGIAGPTGDARRRRFTVVLSFFHRPLQRVEGDVDVILTSPFSLGGDSHQNSFMPSTYDKRSSHVTS